MNRILIVATMCAILLSSCKSGGRTQEPEAVSGPLLAETEEIVPYFNPAFLSGPIPPAVEARMRGKSYPDDATIGLDELRYLEVAYYDFDGVRHMGELVCNAAIAQDLLDIFKALYEAKYPICRIRLVDDYDASDDRSMEADNTSCFNYRTVPGTQKLSKHARGLAIDINPLENPYIDRSGKVRPEGAEPYVDRSKDFPHKIDRDDLCYRLFIEHGFKWGGAWSTMKDYQHFEKEL